MASCVRSLADLLRESGAAGRRLPTPAGGRRASIGALFHQQGDHERLLFIRRQTSKRDPWSGHVALPGGRQDAGDAGDDEATARREVLEEVGINLAGAQSAHEAEWAPLGRLCDDRLIHTAGKPLVVSMFGWSRSADEPPPPLEMQASEVADAWWVETRVLRAERLGWRHVGVHEFSPALRETTWLGAALRWAGADRIRFAAIDLPRPLTREAAAAEPAQYQLWGLTLAFLSDTLRATRAITPLIGEGAPRAFRESFRPARDGVLPALGFRLVMAGGGWLRRASGLRKQLFAGAVGTLALAAAAGLITRVTLSR